MKSIYDKLAEAMQSYQTLQPSVPVAGPSPLEQRLAQEEELRRQKLMQINNLITPVQPRNSWKTASDGFSSSLKDYMKKKQGSGSAPAGE